MLSTNQPEQEMWKEIGVKLLQEYFLLISIGIYLHSTQSSSPAISFEEWFSGHQSIRPLYETITLSRVNQYLSVSVEELPYMSMQWAVNATSGYLNVHSLLLQQRVCDQENQGIAEKLVMSVKSRDFLFGTIFTKSIVGFCKRFFNKVFTNMFTNVFTNRIFMILFNLGMTYRKRFQNTFILSISTAVPECTYFSIFDKIAFKGMMEWMDLVLLLLMMI